MSARSRLLPARIRDERGFGMVELLAAMTVLLVGVLAVFSLFQAGIIQIRRASTTTTAAALADAEMEKFRAIKYEKLALSNDDIDALASGDPYKSDSAYRTDGAATTTLNGSITSSATTLTVTSLTGFPNSPEFRVKIDSEILLVTAIDASTLTLTVTRAQDGTTAASHSGSQVQLIERVHLPKCSLSSPPCTDLAPTKSSTGADGRSYRVDTYITWTQVTNDDDVAGRSVKRITIVVRDSAAPHTRWAQVTSIFDESTGL